MKQSEYLRLMLEALTETSWKLAFGDDGGDEQVKLASVDDAMQMAKSVEMSHIFFRRDDWPAKPAGRAEYICVIWQGPDETYQQGEEIISDCTLEIGCVIDAVDYMLKRNAEVAAELEHWKKNWTAGLQEAAEKLP